MAEPVEAEAVWSDLVDVLPEEFRCHRRDENPLADSAFPGQDHWHKFKTPHGDRVCSYCGSLHFEDFTALVKQAIDPDSTVSIEASDKRYKVYVTRKGIRNAQEGGIKFYMQHCPPFEEITQQQHEELAAACAASHQRMRAELAR